jgi:hypothetical protein
MSRTSVMLYAAAKLSPSSWMVVSSNECCRLSLKLDLTSRSLALRQCSTRTHFEGVPQPNYVPSFTLTPLKLEQTSLCLERHISTLWGGKISLRTISIETDILCRKRQSENLLFWIVVD